MSNQNQFLDIVASGGTNFQVHLIDNYDPEESPSMQEGDFLGTVEFGEIDSDGQFIGEDDDVITAVRSQFELADKIPSEVR